MRRRTVGTFLYYKKKALPAKGKGIDFQKKKFLSNGHGVGRVLFQNLRNKLFDALFFLIDVFGIRQCSFAFALPYQFPVFGVYEIYV
jgi:hypothetical protein